MKTRIEPSEIIESSKSLFGKHGFKKVTMTDIAIAAQISRPTLYSLFTDKDAVFAACILSHIAEFKTESQARIGSARTAREKLEALFDIYIIRPFTWYFESEAYDMLVNASLYAPSEMAILWSDFESGIRSAVESDSKKSEISDRDVAKVLVCFARDVRLHAKNLKELRRLIDVAIWLTLAGSKV